MLLETPAFVVNPLGSWNCWALAQYALSTILYTFMLLLKLVRSCGMYIIAARPPMLQPVKSSVGRAVFIVAGLIAGVESVVVSSVTAGMRVLPLPSVFNGLDGAAVLGVGAGPATATGVTTGVGVGTCAVGLGLATGPVAVLTAAADVEAVGVHKPHAAGQF